MTITYRTTDLAKWGAGQGSNLSAAQVDNNFWTLYEAVQSISAEAGVGIVSATVSGNQLTFTLTDSTTLGPFTLPTIALNPRGNWAATTSYDINDVVSANGNVYLVTWTHTSASTFNAGANDGSGHNYYGLLFNIPGNTLPTGGTTGQVLGKNSSTNYDVGWKTYQLDALLDVNITVGSGIDGYYIKWDDATTKWVAAIPSLTALSDINIATGSTIDGQYIRWNDATSKFVVGKPTEVKTQSVTATGSITISRSDGEIVLMSLTGSVTGFSVTNWPSSGTYGQLFLQIANTGAYNVTAWPTGTIWAGGAAPTITSGAGKLDRIRLSTTDGGTTIYGEVIGQNYS